MKAIKSVDPNLFKLENNVFSMEARKHYKSITCNSVKHVWQDFFIIQQLFTTWDKKVNNEMLEQLCKFLKRY